MKRLIVSYMVVGGILQCLVADTRVLSPKISLKTCLVAGGIAASAYVSYRYATTRSEEQAGIFTQLFDMSSSQQQYAPESVESVCELVKMAVMHGATISIVGAGKSQGGQTYSGRSGYRVSLHKMNRLIALDTIAREVTVQAGVTWRQLEEIIAPHGLAVAAMQSYNDFSIGGSLSVNVHGQDLATGQIIRTVVSCKVVTAQGNSITVSRTEHPELFAAVIGGYGLCGIIVEVTLKLLPDVMLERHVTVIDVKDFVQHFATQIKGDSQIEFYSARFVVAPHHFLEKACVITYRKAALCEAPPYTLTPVVASSLMQKLFSLTASYPWIKDVRYWVSQTFFSKGTESISRNNFLNYSIAGLPQNTSSRRYILQEYFIPYRAVMPFVDALREKSLQYDINLLNVTARHVYSDTESLLSYAPDEEMCALVLYLAVDRNERSYEIVARWTEKVIDAALQCGGSYYLPYQLLASQEQFEAAYPRWREFCAFKRRVDPKGVFSNSLYEKYNVERESYEVLV